MSANRGRFNKYLYRYWRLQAAVILLGLVSLPLSLANPYLSKLLIDQAYGNKNLRLFFILALIGGSIFVFNGLLNSLSSYLSQRIRRKVHFALSRDLFRHLQDLPLSFFQDKSTGEHIYKLISDTTAVSNFVCTSLPQIIELFPRLLFILAIVFYLNWKLALLALLLVPVSYIQPYFFSKWLRELTRRFIEKSQQLWVRLEEVFSHIYLVKALGKERDEINRFERALAEEVELELKNSRTSNIGSFFSAILNKVIAGIIALYGGYQVIKGTISLGSLTAVMIYLTQLIGLVKSLGQFYESCAVNSVSCQRLSEVLDIQPRIKDAEDAVICPPVQGEIDFKDISFGYKEEEFVLRGLNFSVAPRAKIALVGPSGCGKTTLISLLLRIYQPKAGAIFIDGLDIRNLKMATLKAQIGIVLQQPFLWSDTVSANILYDQENAAKEEIMQAAEIAYAHNFILKLPKQYDTLLGENACKLSEGQRERIAIARAIVKKPKILILDEAMSSLDSQTEGAIIDNVSREFPDSTVICVSHRLSAVKRMDLVYFLDGPGRMEIATHSQLVKSNSKYRNLFVAQMETQANKVETVA